MKITHDLRRDHELILQALELLGDVCDAASDGTPVPAGDLAALLEFFAVFADGQHHAKEEEMLFPALVAAGLPPQGGPVMVMLAEHEEGRGYLRRLRSLSGSLSSPTTRATFITIAQQYRALLEQHVAKENHVLFVMADRLLKGREGPLDEALAKNERSLPPDATYDRWVARVATLREVLRTRDRRIAVEATT